MQSNVNSVREHVVFDGVNMAYRDEKNILDQMYKKQISSDFYYKYFKISKCLQKMHI